MTLVALPVIIVPLALLFVLMIILVTKAPRAGLWVVSGLVLLAPVFLYRFLTAGAFPHAGPAAIPLVMVVVPVTFLFVLLVILLVKAPKVGAGLIVALLIIVAVMGVFFTRPVVRLQESYASRGQRQQVRPVRPQPAPGAGRSTSEVGELVRMPRRLPDQRVHEIAEFDRVFDSFALRPGGVAGPASYEPSPIWSEGIEQTFDADVYPSKISALRVAGSQLGKSIRGLLRDANSVSSVVIFQQGQEYGLIAELRDAVKRALPDISCAVEAEHRSISPHEMAVTVGFADLDTHPAPWAESRETKTASGRMDVSVSGSDGTARIPVRFTEKPWVEDFATFANLRPQETFLVAISNSACLSEGEAREQAMHDAGNQLQRLLGRTRKIPGGGELVIRPPDLQEGGFVVDTFLQSFHGTAGKIWRQAILIDASPEKLASLNAHMSRVDQRIRWTVARMGFSVIGVLVLIGGIYFFLNAATMGYYEWSLRIAGIVLAIIGVISVLMIVQ